MHARRCILLYTLKAWMNLLVFSQKKSYFQTRKSSTVAWQSGCRSSILFSLLCICISSFLKRKDASPLLMWQFDDRCASLPPPQKLYQPHLELSMGAMHDKTSRARGGKGNSSPFGHPLTASLLYLPAPSSSFVSCNEIVFLFTGLPQESYREEQMQAC